MTDELVDERKIATELSQRAIDRILSSGEKKIREYWARFKNRDVTTYADYLVRKGVQANAVRNFIYDKRDASLYDIYIPTRISKAWIGELDGNQFLSALCKAQDDPTKRPAPAYVITGDAGSGKSLFMKHAFFQLQGLDAKRIPVLVEVRTFNRLKLENLIYRVFEDIAATGVVVTLEQIEHGLDVGLFVILLDGMDELKGNIQRHYEAELLSFTHRFPACPILVSSRPSNRINSWSNFNIERILPLNVKAAQNLIERLEFNRKVKREFKNLLKKSLFETHYEFASVPLLCTIMLLTYSDCGRIAKNRHEFFEEAFAALWSKHDGHKEGFERQRYTGLQKNEFARLLAAFAISSYLAADYDMRDGHFRQHFEAAIRLSGMSCREEDFLRDLTESTSLCVEDGPYIRFCHRSFHEYFSALFICESDDSSVGSLIEEVSDRLETDYVLPLVLSIRDERIERHWVLPKAKQISESINALDSEINSYANLAFADSEANISIEMRKLRILYGFSPTGEVLQAAFDAAKDMNITISSLEGEALFGDDRKNFLLLAGRLIAKCECRASALHDLLTQASERVHPSKK